MLPVVQKAQIYLSQWIVRIIDDNHLRFVVEFAR